MAVVDRLEGFEDQRPRSSRLPYWLSPVSTGLVIGRERRVRAQLGDVQKVRLVHRF